MIEFILGIFLGILTAIGLILFGTYWICTRSDTQAAAKFILGIIAQALAHGPNAPEPAAPGKDGEAKEEARGSR